MSEREQRFRDVRGRMLLLAAAGIAAAALVVLLLLRPPAEDVEVPPVAPPPMAVAEPLSLELYFPGEDGLLHSEARQVDAAEDVETLVRLLVETLLGGPEDELLLRSLPQEVTVGRVYLLDGTTAYVDLEAEGTPPPTGSLGEMLTVYGIVNSVVLNVDVVDRVVLLWNGRQPTTFSGHVDTTRPLVPNLSLVADGRRAAADSF